MATVFYKIIIIAIFKISSFVLML